MARPSRHSLAEELSRQIHAGQLVVGEKLPGERVLAEHFGVSRPVVREVLRDLQARGLVEIIPAQGSFVRQPTTAAGAASMESHYRRRNVTARHVQEARRVLESQSARAAATNATEVEIRALWYCVDGCEDADNALDRATHDLAFHGLLARASRNPVLEAMFASISGFCFELMLRSQSDPEIVRRGVPLHRVVTEAIAAGDADAAESAMREHLDIASALYGADYDRSLVNRPQRGVPRSIQPPAPLEEFLDRIVRHVEGMPELGDAQERSGS